MKRWRMWGDRLRVLSTSTKAAPSPGTPGLLWRRGAGRPGRTRRRPAVEEETGGVGRGGWREPKMMRLILVI